MTTSTEDRQIQQATDLGLRIQALLRAGEPEAAHALTSGLDLHGARTVIAVLAAMLPPRTDPRASLAWVERPSARRVS